MPSSPRKGTGASGIESRDCAPPDAVHSRISYSNATPSWRRSAVIQGPHNGEADDLPSAWWNRTWSYRVLSRRGLLAGNQGGYSDVGPKRCVLAFRSRCCADCSRGNDIVDGRAITRTGRLATIRKRSVGGCSEQRRNRLQRPPQVLSLPSEWRGCGGRSRRRDYRVGSWDRRGPEQARLL